MGIVLYILATVLWILITPINWVIVCFKYGLSNDYFKETAIDIDRFANRNFRTFLNLTMRIKNGYAFGDERETISSALGKNQRDSTLSWFGECICFVLDLLDENHCVKSIKELK